MRWLTRRVRARRGEEGSALVLALVFASIFSLFVASMVTFADTGLKSARALKEKRAASFAADGAMEAAINRFRVGSPCDDYTPPLAPDGRPVGDQGLVVRCENIVAPAAGSINKPAHALLSLGSDPAEGIHATSPELRVRGDVFSRSTVTASGSLVVEGNVSAIGDCTPAGNIRTEPPAPLKCANTGGGADEVFGRDPDFTKATYTVPPRRQVPATCSGWLVALPPGYYDDAQALSRLTNGTVPACDDAVVWLQPGIYYFNFGFGPGSATKPKVWTVNDPGVDVVGGTPKGWDPASGSRPTAQQLDVPGSCKIEGDAGAVDGVQVIMGGESSVDVSAGAQMELCASPNSSDQQVALYGLPATDTSHSLRPTATGSVSGFSDPENALVIGETPPPPAAAPATADATLSDTTSTSSLTVSGFRPTVPVGSVIDSVVVRVAHGESGDMGPVRVTANFPGDTCGAISLSHNTTGIGEDEVDLRACGLDQASELSQLKVQFTAELGDGGVQATARLDGVAIDVGYRVPTTRKATVATPVSGFTSTENALEIGERPVPLTSDAPLTPSAPSAAMTLVGYGEPAIPSNAVIDSAVLRVVHQEDDDVGTVSVDAQFTGSTCDEELDLSPDELSEQAVDLKACGLATGARLNELRVAYGAQLEPDGVAGTAILDGIWLDVVYTSPSAARGPATATSAEFTNPDRARAIGELPNVLTADAELADGGVTAASLEVENFAGTPAVPPGSVIDSALLRVAHRDVGAVASVDVTLDFPELSTLCSGPRPLTIRPNAIGEDTIDLEACGLTVETLDDLSVTYKVTLTPGPGNTATDNLDGIVLDLAYRPPAAHKPAMTGSVTRFADPDNAKEIDGVTSDAALEPANSTGSMTLTGYGQVPLPAGSVVDAAHVLVAHQDEGSVGAIAVTPSFPGSTCATPATVDPHPATIVEERVIDLVAQCGLDEASDVTALSVKYDVALAPLAAVSGTAMLDGIWLEVVFRPPAFEPLSGCTQQTYPGGGACALVRSVADSPATRFAVQGTVYAPSAAVDLSMDEVDAQVLTRGVVARTIRLGLDPAQGYRRSAAAVPPEAVQFTAYPVPAASTRNPQSAGGVTFPEPEKAQAADGQTADVTLSTATPTGSLTVSGFNSPAVAPVPAGSVIDMAVLRILHRDEGDIDPPEVSVAFTGTNSCSVPRPLPVRAGALTEDWIDVRACGVRSAAELATLSATYSVELSAGGTAATDSVDAIVLDVAYRGPVTHKPSAATSADFTNPEAAKEIGEDPLETADAALDSSTRPSAAITLNGFQEPALAASAAIDSAVVRIVHHEVSNVESVKVTATFTDNTCADHTVPLSDTGFSENRIDLRTCGLARPDQLAGLSITYTAVLDDGQPSGLARLDGIWVDVTSFSDPYLRSRVSFTPTQVTVEGWSVLR